MKPKILILCTGNTCRSQMAEGLLRAAAGDILDVHSAGSKPAGFVQPLAIKAMAEIGIDISRHQSKGLLPFLQEKIDAIIIVCAKADRDCPIFPGVAKCYYWPFHDPAHTKGSEEHRLKEFRRIRDKIKLKLDEYAADRRRELQMTKLF